LPLSTTAINAAAQLTVNGDDSLCQRQ
jgi:hypothetical protein